MENIAVYVPTGDLFGIARRSGIVGTEVVENADLVTEGVASRRLLVDYEGNVYGAQNVVTFADRVFQAWGRHSTRYPTVARLSLPPETMRKVGDFLPDLGRVYIDGPEERLLLEEWIGEHPIPNWELEVTRP